MGLFVTVFIWLDEKPKGTTTAVQDVRTPVSSESSARESPRVDEARLEAVNADDDQWLGDVTIPLRAHMCLRATYVNNGSSAQEVRMRLEGVEGMLFSDGSVCTAKFATPEANVSPRV